MQVETKVSPQDGPNLVYDAGANQILFNVITADEPRTGFRTRTMALDLVTLRLRHVGEVVDSIPYPWLDQGSTSRLLYLFGAEGINIAVLDSTARKVTGRVHRSRDKQHSWSVYRARMSPGESRAYLSYHGCLPRVSGSCTTGIDWVSMDKALSSSQRRFARTDGSGQGSSV